MVLGLAAGLSSIGTGAALAKGPTVPGPSTYGLCTAYQHGQGGANGNKNQAPPFQNLQTAASNAGQSVSDFCSNATPGGK